MTIASNGRVTRDARLERWQSRTEWPLATVAVIFLGAYSVRVLVQPQGPTETALQAIIWTTWAVFLIDYIARLALSTNRTRWFIRHLLDLAVVALPLLRPLRLLRLVVLVAALQKAIGGAIRGRVIVYTACSVVLLVYVASLAILDTERYELARRSPLSVMRCGGPSPPSPPWDTATYHRSRARVE